MRPTRAAVAAFLLAPFAALVLMLGGCAPTIAQPATVSQEARATIEAGNTLDAVGRTFAQTYDLYNNAYLARKVPEEQYRRWVSWASDFQVAYPLAVAAFTGATTPGDRSTALERALRLKTDLLIYFVGIGGQL